MITIEQEPARRSTCDCCGGQTTNLVRYVSRDEDAHAVYFAAFSDEHPERGVSALVGLGSWTEGSTAADRRAFGLRIWNESDGFHVGVVDAATLGWPEPSRLGRRLGREEALADPDIAEVFHLSDHMVADDEEIAAFFERTAAKS